jgi:hypothetical protein
LELKYPQISGTIRRNPEIFIGMSRIEGDSVIQDHMDTVETSDEKKEIDKKYIDELLNDYKIEEKRNIRSMLNFLFPELLSKWTQYSPQEAAYNNRISNREALLKLLHSGQTKYVYSSKEIKHFLESDVDRKEILIDFLETGNLYEWLDYVGNFIPQSRIRDPFALCKNLISIGNTSFVEKGINLTDSIGNVILDIFKATDKPEDKMKLLEIISTNEESLSISEYVILRLLSKYDMWDSGTYIGIKKGTEGNYPKLGFELQRLVDIKDAWIKTLKIVISKKYLFQSEPNPISILFRWGQLNDNNYQDVKTYISNEIQDEGHFRDFLNYFDEGKGLTGIENILNISEFRDKLALLDNPPPASGKFISYFKELDKSQK